MNNANGKPCTQVHPLIAEDNQQDNLVSAGFERIKSKHFEKRPPKIHWGRLYKEMSTDKQIAYLEKLASTMNHAASLIQSERDYLGKLCEAKEAQLLKQDKMVKDSQAMLQHEVTKMNEQKQYYIAEMQKLKGRIKELEHGSLY